MTHWCTTRNGFTVDDPDTTPRKIMNAPIIVGLFLEPAFTEESGDASAQIWARSDATLYPTMGSACSSLRGETSTRESLSEGVRHA